MKLSRRTQPYRRGAAGRPAGRTLAAMLAGSTATGANPADVQRTLAKRARRRKRRVRRSGLAAKLSATPRTLRG